MNRNKSREIALITIISACAVSMCHASVVVAAGDLIIPVSQTRTVTGFAAVDDKKDSAADGDEDMALDLLPFAGNAAAQADLPDGTASGGGEQSSSISSSMITASGSAFATAESFNFGVFADASGDSEVLFTFTITEEVSYIFSGMIAGFDFGSSEVAIRKDGIVVTDYFAFGPASKVFIAESGVLEPGSYEFTASASGSAFGADFSSEFAFAEYEVALSLTQTAGDMNCDGIISVSDIAPFVLALTDPAGYAAQFPDCDINRGDLNGDGSVSVGDIGLFVALLTGA